MSSNLNSYISTVKFQNRYRLIIFSFLLFIVGIGFCNDLKPVLLKGEQRDIWVKSDYVQVLCDSNNSLHIKDIINNKSFESAHDEIYSDYDGGVYWLRFELVQDNEENIPYRLEFYDFDIEEIDFFHENNNGDIIELRAGYSLPFSARDLDHKNVSFTVDFGHKKTMMCYLRLETSKRNSLKPVIKTYREAFNYGMKEYLFFGIFYGLFLFMITYNFVYFLILRRREYILYVLYAVGILVYLMSENGTGFQFLWPFAPSFNHYMSFAGLFVSITSLMLFAMDFLKLRNEAHFLYKLFWIGIALRVVLFALEITFLYKFLGHYFDIFLLQLVLYACIHRYNNGFKNVIWVLISFVLLDVSLIINILEHIDWIKSSFITVYSINIGLVAQFILMSIGVAESVNKAYKEKSQAQDGLLNLTEQLKKDLELQVEQRTIELQRKNEQITSSVRYAQKIQHAVLPSEMILDQCIPDRYLYYKPRDIVSGDYYWFYPIDAQKYIVVLADCTGHGVPGAFMSMIGINLLNTIVNEKTIVPHLILETLHQEVKDILRQEETHNQDGMDLSICLVDTVKKELVFAGAKSSIILLKDDKIERIRGNKQSIGGIDFKNHVCFESVTVDFSGVNTKLFMYTDGVVDQFGGDVEKKFGVRKLMSLIDANQEKSITDFGLAFEAEFENWMSKSDFQIDDISLFAIQLNKK